MGNCAGRTLAASGGAGPQAAPPNLAWGKSTSSESTRNIEFSKEDLLRPATSILRERNEADAFKAIVEQTKREQSQH